MIISRILGGLGNQMFQYAAGRALSLRVREPLLLDLDAFSGYGLHNGFELSTVFTIRPQVAGDDDIRKMLGWRAGGIARRLLARPALQAFRGRRLVIEPGQEYWEGIKQLRDPAYLYGYWQSEKYFDDAADAIRRDFRFAHPLQDRNAELAQAISQQTSISVHVRRGDYVTDPKTRAILGLCSPSYYSTAVSLLSSRFRDAAFFVFSDDIEWASDNLEFANPVHFVDHNQGSDSHFDMQLMSLCNHQIIANSSFSWWAAWLNRHPGKKVIAPRNWFSGGRSTRDLLPGEWLTL